MGTSDLRKAVRPGSINPTGCMYLYMMIYIYIYFGPEVFSRCLLWDDIWLLGISGKDLLRILGPIRVRVHKGVIAGEVGRYYSGSIPHRRQRLLCRDIWKAWQARFHGSICTHNER